MAHKEQVGKCWIVDYIIFKDVQRVYENCEQCQRASRSILRRDEMPQQPMLYCEVFDILGIDFMGPFPPSKEESSARTFKVNGHRLRIFNENQDMLNKTMDGVATGIATGRRTEKKKTGLKEIWSRHHSYSGKLWKTIKIKQVCKKPDFGSESRLRIGKVLTPYRARPRAVPLIKNVKLM